MLGYYVTLSNEPRFEDTSLTNMLNAQDHTSLLVVCIKSALADIQSACRKLPDRDDNIGISYALKFDAAKII